jgi:hypothetical protein
VLIRTPPEYLASMKTHKFLVSLPGWGPSKARRAMLRVGISDAKTIGGLSDRQRAELVALVDAGVVRHA